MNSPTSGRAPRLTIGVYDEPELVVHGVDGMLARSRPRPEVLTVCPEGTKSEVDVLLCDPVGRTLPLEDYLGMVAAVSSAPVLVFTWSSSPSSVRRVMAAGARGFLSKTSSAADLAAAVGAVHRGQTVSPPAGRTARTDAAELSAREAEVLELICAGLSNLEIADELFVSVNSVKTYVRQIYQKIGVTRRAQAVAWGLTRGF